jgi:hypothetical protein
MTKTSFNHHRQSQTVSTASQFRGFNSDYSKRTIVVFRHDSPATRSRRSIGSGGESSSMLTSVEGNAVQAFSKGNNFLPHCVA